MSLKKPLVWFLLVATLFSAWTGVLHAHEEGTPQQWAATALVDGGLAEDDGAPDVDGECHCLWCAPQLHAAAAACDQIVRIALLETAASPPRWSVASPVPALPRGSVPPPRGPPLHA
ncbi:DUF2946 family protein [Variovorax sp. W2I14]|uniref:DUF2946 family protein n=1 Tax=Variovorax sp. W2I14 TaxID=3042290 RepID=UPI003D197487